MTSKHTVVFLDANVLAKPITRTLLLLGGEQSGHKMVWSSRAEIEADRHMRPGARLVSDVRVRIGAQLSPPGIEPQRFTATSDADRHILADAEAAKAQFLVTEDVDDFADVDLAALKISATNPDLFMSVRFGRVAYLHALDMMVSNMTNPPRSAAELHSLVSKQHPRLFAAHEHAFDVLPAASAHRPPSVLFRGRRCLRCGHAVTAGHELLDGIEPACRAQV